MAKKVVIPFEVVDKFSKNLKNLNARLQQIEKSTKTQNTAFNLLSADIIFRYGSQALGAVKNFGLEALRAFKVQETAIKRANESMRINGELTEQSSQKIQDWAASLQMLTGIGDDVILNQFALASSFTGSAEGAQKLVEAAQDFAQAADLNMTEAVRRLGRAMKGTVDDVAKFDERILKLTKSQLAAGGAADLIGEKFAGLAAAQMDTLEGKTALLAQRFGDLNEKAGEFLEGPAEGLIDWGNDFVTVADFVIERLEKMEKKTFFERATEKTKDLTRWMFNLGVRTGVVTSAQAALADILLTASTAEDTATNSTKKKVEADTDAIRIATERAEAEKAFREEKLLADAFILEFDIANAEGAVERFDLVAAKKLATLKKSVTDEGLIKKAEAAIDKTRDKIRRDQKKKDNKEMAQNFVSTLGFISSAAASENKTLARIGRVASIANATAKTYEAANVALASAPAPFSFALAAIVTAVGLANVAKIASAPGFEHGGRPPLGRDVLVGENGPEIRRFDSGSEIIPNHAIGNTQGTSFGGVAQPAIIVENMNITIVSPDPDEIIDVLAEAFKSEDSGTIAAARRITDISARNQEQAV